MWFCTSSGTWLPARCAEYGLQEKPMTRRSGDNAGNLQSESGCIKQVPHPNLFRALISSNQQEACKPFCLQNRWAVCLGSHATTLSKANSKSCITFAGALLPEKAVNNWIGRCCAPNQASRRGKCLCTKLCQGPVHDPSAPGMLSTWPEHTETLPMHNEAGWQTSVPVYL